MKNHRAKPARRCTGPKWFRSVGLQFPNRFPDDPEPFDVTRGDGIGSRKFRMDFPADASMEEVTEFLDRARGFVAARWTELVCGRDGPARRWDRLGMPARARQARKSQLVTNPHAA